eukprot:6319047-Pyramimonas_sp.AAC.1
MFWVIVGVLHGDPLSGSLFVLAVLPFCSGLERTLEAALKGIGRWRADDAGAVVRGGPGLRVLARVFRISRRRARLGLKPAKCAATPLWAPWSEELCDPPLSFLERRALNGGRL